MKAIMEAGMILCRNLEKIIYSPLCGWGICVTTNESHCYIPTKAGCVSGPKGGEK